MATAKAVAKKGQNQSSEREEFINRLKKNLIWSLLIIVFVLILFIVVPIVSRNYFVQSLKISENIFVSAPENIKLVSTSEVGVCYPVKINGYTFHIPERFTPTKITSNAAEFRMTSHSSGRYIYVHAEKQTKRMNFKSNGITRWFLPTEMRKILPLILNSDWHPIRLMYKYQIYASEGINSKIFQTNWNQNHKGYIFPCPGNEGYLGRIFRMDGDGTVDFLISDGITPVSLREWVNIAMKLETPQKGEKKVADNSKAPSQYSLDDIIAKAEKPNNQRKTLEIGLTEFYRTNSPEWLIPVAIVMQKRGFYPEVLELINQYQSRFEEDTKYLPKWNELLDKAISECISIEVDPITNLKELNIYLKNLTHLDIKQVAIDVEITSGFGTKQSFAPTLLNQNTLRSKEEKQLKIRCPHDFNLSEASKIEHRITKIEFAK